MELKRSLIFTVKIDFTKYNSGQEVEPTWLLDMSYDLSHNLDLFSKANQVAYQNPIDSPDSFYTNQPAKNLQNPYKCEKLEGDGQMKLGSHCSKVIAPLIYVKKQLR